MVVPIKLKITIFQTSVTILLVILTDRNAWTILLHLLLEINTHLMLSWSDEVHSIQYYVIKWLVTGRLFSQSTLISSTNKTDCQDITEILLNVVLNTITLIHYICWVSFLLSNNLLHLYKIVLVYKFDFYNII